MRLRRPMFIMGAAVGAGGRQGGLVVAPEVSPAQDQEPMCRQGAAAGMPTSEPITHNDNESLQRRESARAIAEPCMLTRAAQRAGQRLASPASCSMPNIPFNTVRLHTVFDARDCCGAGACAMWLACQGLGAAAGTTTRRGHCHPEKQQHDQEIYRKFCCWMVVSRLPN